MCLWPIGTLCLDGGSYGNFTSPYVTFCAKGSMKSIAKISNWRELGRICGENFNIIVLWSCEKCVMCTLTYRFFQMLWCHVNATHSLLSPQKPSNSIEIDENKCGPSFRWQFTVRVRLPKTGIHAWNAARFNKGAEVRPFIDFFFNGSIPSFRNVWRLGCGKLDSWAMLSIRAGLFFKRESPVELKQGSIQSIF